MKDEFVNETHEEIIQWIKELKLKKKMLGGVDEEDVYRKINELNTLYEKALLNERARYDALLQAYKDGGKYDQ